MPKYKKVNEGVIISDPGLKLNAAKAKRLADDPEFTIKPYFFPNILETVFSSNLTFFPSIKDKLLFLRTLITAFTSLWLYTALP